MSEQETESILFPDISLFEESEDEGELDQQPQISAWAKSKIGTFQSRLEALKASNDHKQRRSRGRKILTRLLVSLVNEAFGFNGWSSSILDCCSVADDFNTEQETYSIEQRATVRITFQDGTFVDAEGKGYSLDCKQRAVGYSTSKKMAVTDGLRNAIMLFPDLLSNQS
ncbi:hypothetical protein PUMCH_002512 [Australozyma saopauloensis]|uniref:DNA repair and recombination protein RAD52 n=1 Tax=Australozyma saopauloensis TaxID=291208 RepID=A0AAX4H9H6_9ASCO|nr:hypothetical protein PUMCH_002512 [[Candida] saopauloensis]